MQTPDGMPMTVAEQPVSGHFLCRTSRSVGTGASKNIRLSIHFHISVVLTQPAAVMAMALARRQSIVPRQDGKSTSTRVWSAITLKTDLMAPISVVLGLR